MRWLANIAIALIGSLLELIFFLLLHLVLLVILLFTTPAILVSFALGRNDYLGNVVAGYCKAIETWKRIRPF
jgi:hypothetical protein